MPVVHQTSSILGSAKGSAVFGIMRVLHATKASPFVVSVKHMYTHDVSRADLNFRRHLVDRLTDAKTSDALLQSFRP